MCIWYFVRNTLVWLIRVKRYAMLLKIPVAGWSSSIPHPVTWNNVGGQRLLDQRFLECQPDVGPTLLDNVGSTLWRRDVCFWVERCWIPHYFQAGCLLATCWGDVGPTSPTNIGPTLFGQCQPDVGPTLESTFWRYLIFFFLK